MARLQCFAAIIGIALTCVFAQEHYSSQYDYIDVNAILANNKLRNQYYKCMMDIEPCVTADSKFFKELIFEAITTKCVKCTERQKNMLDDVIVWYTTNDNEKWLKVLEKSINEARKRNASR